MESRQARLDRINNQRKELREPGIPIRLSSGFGSVRYIGGTYRRRPYAVHPPTGKISVVSDGKQCAFYCEKNIAQYVEMPDTEPAEHHDPFSDEELKTL